MLAYALRLSQKGAVEDRVIGFEEGRLLERAERIRLAPEPSLELSLAQQASNSSRGAPIQRRNPLGRGHTAAEHGSSAPCHRSERLDHPLGPPSSITQRNQAFQCPKTHLVIDPARIQERSAGGVVITRIDV